MRATVATIDLDALEWNVNRVRARAAGRAVLGMVKANAYGHGMIDIARVLEQMGLDVLGTAFVDEALALRKGGINGPILVLTPIERHEIDIVVEHNLITVACDLSGVQALSDYARDQGRKASVHLYVDTGMLREGFRPHEAIDAARHIRQMEGVQLDGLCTHFATADEPASTFLREQLSTFEQTHRQLIDDGCTFVWVHAANTGALWQASDSHYTLVRPGISVYGYDHALGDEMTLRPVMSIRSRVVSKRRAWPGETVSYGRKYMVSAETTIVTVPIGYGDGYLRGLSGRAQCLIGGRRYPIVGSICMDEMMVDVGDDQVEIGSEVVLLGMQATSDGHVESIDAVDLATWAGTIPYEITTAISARVPRTYVGGSAHHAQAASSEPR